MEAYLISPINNSSNYQTITTNPPEEQEVEQQKTYAQGFLCIGQFPLCAPLSLKVFVGLFYSLQCTAINNLINSLARHLHHLRCFPIPIKLQPYHVLLWVAENYNATHSLYVALTELCCTSIECARWSIKRSHYHWLR